MTLKYFLKIHLLFSALLFSCNVFSDPVLGQQEGAALLPGSQITWSDTDVGSEYWVYVGSSPGARNLLDSGSISNQMSITVADWPAEYFVRLWYRPTGLGWAFVDTRFINVSCPAPVREQYDMVKERVDNGALVLKDASEFNGVFCYATYGVDTDNAFDYQFSIGTQAEAFEEVDVVPARVTARGLTLWMTKGEALACVKYINC